MTRTFLVAVTLDDSLDLAALAGDMDDDLLAAGWEVESVKPWNAPGPDLQQALSAMQPRAQPEPPPTLT